jgi:hypothetical protein
VVNSQTAIPIPGQTAIAAADLPPNPQGTPEPEVGAGAKRERKGRGRPKGYKPPPKDGPNQTIKKECREIQTKLTALLARPAIPMHLAGDAWPAAHIEQNSPGLAHAIALACETNAALRAQLNRLLTIGDGASLVFAAAAYLAPVLIYYGIIPAPPMVRVQLGVPTRAEARGESIADTMRKMQDQARAPQQYPVPDPDGSYPDPTQAPAPGPVPAPGAPAA